MEEFHLLRILLGLIQKNSFLSSYYKLSKFSWEFWFHLLQLYRMICLCILVDTPDHQSFCSMGRHLYGRKIETFISSNFRAWILSRSKYLEFTTFYGSTFWSGEVLLNWSNKRARLGGGVKSIELFLLETFYDTFLQYNRVDEKSLLFKNPKGNIELQH